MTVNAKVGSGSKTVDNVPPGHVITLSGKWPLYLTVKNNFGRNDLVIIGATKGHENHLKSPDSKVGMNKGDMFSGSRVEKDHGPLNVYEDG